MSMRLLASSILQKSSHHIIHRPFDILSPPTNFSHMIDARRVQFFHATSRNLDSAEGVPRVYLYSDVQNVINAPSDARALIDVREPEELHLSGTIPSSLNIPFISAPDAFSKTADEFKNRFGFDRPSEKVELIFFCRSGVRSLKAANLALKAGWSRVGDYSGSWLDWEKNGGKKLMVTPEGK